MNSFATLRVNKHLRPVLVSGGLVLALGLLVFTPPVARRRRAQAASYVTRAAVIGHTDLAQALRLTRYASLLTPHDSTIWLRLAALDLEQGSVDAAIQALTQAGTPGARVQIIDTLIASGQLTEAVRRAGDYWRRDHDPRDLIAASRAELELAQITPATSLAEQAVRESSGGGQVTSMDTLAAAQAQLSLVEAVGRVQDLAPSNYALAATLARGGLLRSAERVLAGESAPYSAESRLLATVRLELYPSDRAKLSSTASDLEAAIQQDPADTRLRRLLIRAYTALGETKKAATQQDLVQHLEDGRV